MQSLLWAALPVLPLLRRRGWIAVLAFTGVPLVAALASASPHQYGLRLHYSAPVMVTLALAVVEAAARREDRPPAAGPVPARAWPRFLPAPWIVFLTVLTMAAHLYGGFLRGGGQHNRVYGRVHPDGRRLLEAARHIPRQGVLLCPDALSPFCANRADLLVWGLFDPGKHNFDLVFITARELGSAAGAPIARLLETGEIGVRYYDGFAAVLERGYDTGRNGEVLVR